jgi:hypothetical protein
MDYSGVIVTSFEDSDGFYYTDDLDGMMYRTWFFADQIYGFSYTAIDGDAGDLGYETIG